jgi:hypothetical protein
MVEPSYGGVTITWNDMLLIRALYEQNPSINWNSVCEHMGYSKNYLNRLWNTLFEKNQTIDWIALSEETSRSVLDLQNNYQQQRFETAPWPTIQGKRRVIINREARKFCSAIFHQHTHIANHVRHVGEYVVSITSQFPDLIIILGIKSIMQFDWEKL